MKGSKAQLFLDEIVTNYIHKKIPPRITRKASSSLISPTHSPTRLKAPLPSQLDAPSPTPTPLPNQ